MTTRPTAGRWVADGRGDGRAIRVSAHPETGFVIVSIWRSGVCVGTVQLQPSEAAEVLGALSMSLATLVEAAIPELAAGGPPSTGFLTLVDDPTIESPAQPPRQ